MAFLRSLTSEIGLGAAALMLAVLGYSLPAQAQDRQLQAQPRVSQQTSQERLSQGEPQAPEQAGSDRPVFFFQTTVDPFYAAERGGSSTPARGAAVTARPIAGWIVALPDDLRLMALGGASATRYATTSSSDADSIFGMASLTKTIHQHKFGATFLVANSRDPTFAVPVATTYDTTLSVSRTFALPADGWEFTPQLKAARRHANASILERWALNASFELTRPMFGGTFTFGSGYGWLEYIANSRHDDQFNVSSSWVTDVNKYVQVGVRAEATFLKSNFAGKSVDSFEIGPTMKILFAK